MSADEKGSVTDWVGILRSGGDVDAAARGLWGRYFSRLVDLARAKLRAAPRGPADEEDVALSAFESFLRGVVAGRYPDLGDRDALWRLLVTITARKASNARRDATRRKRGGGRVTDEAALAGEDADAGDADFLAEVVDDALTPEFAAIMNEQCRRLIASLADDSLRVVALMKLDGHSNEEIARSLDCGLRTVERKIGVIRKRWLAELEP
jgi:DNA-directed RNA polymerase specialized sigma24 family protein